ncbi:complement factor H-like isoform X3 [Ambystoma mexicanum]|uniref:complement factor H-like isoform X3 n=1 Tax=Ambystoma mexicanum TaxID=8296 RepID=UPI0037E7939A
MNPLGCCLVLMLWACCEAQAPCGKPENVGREEPSGTLKPQYKDGDVVSYTCQPGYIKRGRIQYTCTNGKWVKSGVVCTEKPCGYPGDIGFGNFELTKAEEFVFGARVTYKCIPGYQMISRINYRDCTATGWSNSVPFCEPKKCVQFPAPKGGKIVLTGTYDVDGEIAVGHVLRFECDSPEARPVPNEVYCTQEGEWSTPLVECKEISCTEPDIQGGVITNKKDRFKKNEKLQFICNPGFKYDGRDPECTEQGWNPAPYCKEVLCYYLTLENGEMLPKQETYNEGETVDVQCITGFVTLYSHTSRPTCTKSGWVPPPRCESKACDFPDIENGRVSGWGHYNFPGQYFPMQKGRVIAFYCYQGFATSNGDADGSIRCTENGWIPSPTCLRTCSYPSERNVHIDLESTRYTVGRSVTYVCDSGFTNPEGSVHGSIECQPNGVFSKANCMRTCTISTRSIKNYKPQKTIFSSREKMQYECEDGYRASLNNLVETVECTSGGWYPEPKCTEITCSIPYPPEKLLFRTARNFKNGQVVTFECDNGYTLNGDEKIQCYYFGWYPNVPRCEDSFDQGGEAQPTVKPNATEAIRLKCPQPPELFNTVETATKRVYHHGDKVTYNCKRNYILYGSETITCLNGRWTSPPQCIAKETCSRPPSTKNGRVSELAMKTSFYNYDKATYICDPGYTLIGSKEITCIGRTWPTAPTCTESPCETPSIDHGSIVNLRPSYAHGTTVQFTCDSGYKLSTQSEPRCWKGNWSDLPKCSSTSCSAPPEIDNGSIQSPRRQSYNSGNTVTYKCDAGYVFEKGQLITCMDGQWKNPPACKKVGSRCGPAPSIPNGDVAGTREPFYESGSRVVYQCQALHKMIGSSNVECWNGAWSSVLPECLEPCTARPDEMAANNIRLKWSPESKMYAVHGAFIEFDCTSSEYIKDETLPFRLQCNRGQLVHPRCIRKGSCIASSNEMDKKNIILQRENTEIKNKEVVEFACKSGYYRDANREMKSTCNNGKLNYPECGTTPPACSKPPSIEHGRILGDTNREYTPDSYVEYSCDNDYTLEGVPKLICSGGGWSGEAPHCIQPCHFSQSEMNKNNLELYQSESIQEVVMHKTDIDFKCKQGYIESPSSQLSVQCNNGTITYPSCVLDSPCQVAPEKMEENNVQLNRKHGKKISFVEGETIEFICSSGARTQTPRSLSVKCTAQGFEYPECISPNPCRITQEGMDDNNLEYDGTEIIFKNSQTMEFKCKTSFVQTGPSLLGTCIKNKLTYPTCKPDTACNVSQELENYGIQLHKDDADKRYILNNENIRFICKDGFNLHKGSSSLVQICDMGVIAYPRCVRP